MIRFNDLQVKDVMSNEVLCLPTDATLSEAEASLLEAGFEGAPVVDDDGCYLGTLGLLELTRARADASIRTVGAAMRTDEPTCSETLALAEACQLLVKSRAHRCVVLRDRRPCGVVTGIDAARVLACLHDQGEGWTFQPIDDASIISH
jgi:predicted transcriptional regulator